MTGRVRITKGRPGYKVMPVLFPLALDTALVSGEIEQNALATRGTPTGYFAIPVADVAPYSEASMVAPANGFDGGGLEVLAPHSVPMTNAIRVPFR